MTGEMRADDAGTIVSGTACRQLLELSDRETHPVREPSRCDTPKGPLGWSPPSVQWVVKVSKKCNLRCAYCYEFPFLGDPARISLDDIGRMLRHIAEHYAGTAKRVDFVWHGGEPLLLAPAYYWQILKLQHQILDPRSVPFTNAVQTNLTTLNDDVIDLFCDFFNNVSVSLDPFASERVNIAGRPVGEKVVENMRAIGARGVAFSCITVLSQLTAPRVLEIYDFYSDFGVDFRLLPIYRTGYSGQQDSRSVTPAQIVGTFQKVADRWLTGERPIRIQPIMDYVADVVRQLSSGEDHRRRYTKADGEVVFIVDTDGSLHSHAEAYNARFAYGNIFTTPLRGVLASSGRRRAIERAEHRMSRTCHSCRYWGACRGHFMGEATPEQRWLDDAGNLLCAVAEPMHRHIEQRLRGAGLVNGNVLARSELARRSGHKGIAARES